MKKNDIASYVDKKITGMPEIDQQRFSTALNLFLKVDSIVANNKEDDDAYYEEALLTTENGNRIKAHFKERKIILTHEEKGIDSKYMTFEFKPKEVEGYEPKQELMFGEISLFFYNQGRNGIYLDYDLNINDGGSRQLDQNQINHIMDFLKDINEQIPTIKYNKEGTQQVYNLYELYELLYYQELYEEEMKRAKEEDPNATVIPSVKIATTWWLDMLKAYGNKINEKQARIFKISFARRVTEEILKNKNVIIRSDYTPLEILREAMEEANIQTGPFKYKGPYKTGMNITIDTVNVDGEIIYQVKPSQDILKRIREIKINK